MHRVVTPVLILVILASGAVWGCSSMEKTEKFYELSKLVQELAGTHDVLVTVEENAVIGGAGSEVARALEKCGCAARLLRIGLPDRFVDHGEQGQLLASVGLDKAGIVERIRQAGIGIAAQGSGFARNVSSFPAAAAQKEAK